MVFREGSPYVFIEWVYTACQALTLKHNINNICKGFPLVELSFRGKCMFLDLYVCIFLVDVESDI